MNITFEEIRDIIEKEVYIGSGSVLGISDAARAIVSRIEATQHGLHTDARESTDFSGVIVTANNFASQEVD